MAVKMGVAIVSNNAREFIQQVRMLDEAGVAMIGNGDSQALYHEQFIRAALSAEHTQQARVGTWITNPVMRHPAVTAAAIATVDDLAPGRAFLGVGTGDSTVYNAGLRPANLATLERFINTVRELHQNGESQWEGNPCYLTWADRRIPIGMAVSGPRKRVVVTTRPRPAQSHNASPMHSRRSAEMPALSASRQNNGSQARFRATRKPLVSTARPRTSVRAKAAAMIAPLPIPPHRIIV